MSNENIKVVNAAENNLKNVSIEIPHNKITCFTGVSGSGKSSLVYDVIAREGERRYFESFSAYARQFFGKLKSPEVEHISGLKPVITVDQKTIHRNPRSTVGTISELHDFLRLLFARFGEPSVDYPELKINRSLFSFNSPRGACPHCKGLGVEDQIDPELLISDPGKSLRQGALKITTPSGYTIYSQVTIDVMNDVCNSEGFHVDIPWRDLTEKQKDIILYGSNKIKIPYGKHTLESRMKWSGITAKPREEGFYKGILPIMENILRIDRNPNILRFARTVECSVCGGSRFNPETLSVLFEGRTIAEYLEFSIGDLLKGFERIAETNVSNEALLELIKSIIKRSKQLCNLGLSYLCLNRESTTLSGGEAQRIRLATQIGTGLRDVLYVLDEPSAGLHPKDNQRLVEVMQQLRGNGNTVLVVEHDTQTMLQSDYIVDIGPGSGKEGGEILFQSSVDDLENLQIPESKTLPVLLNKAKVSKGLPLSVGAAFIELNEVKKHNLDNLNLRFMLNAKNVITGVSGAGKSTLGLHVLAPAINALIDGDSISHEIIKDIVGADSLSNVVQIDQSPIGRTPRSNPATYTKMFDAIRKLFAAMPEASEQGFKQGHFSFNAKGGRCETCQGAGVIQTGMHFMGNVETVCETCHGKRFHHDVLEIKYKEKSIYEVLEMEIGQAVIFFKEEKKIKQYLEVLIQLGLGYLALGQPATTLSGGEAQRLKLAAELVKKKKGETLYVFDEPTTGLHYEDVKILDAAFDGLVKNGNTVVIIEHHEDIIRNAHWIIDLGPEAGAKGGQLVFDGSPEDLLKCKLSYTARALNGEIFNDSKTEKREIDPSEGLKLKGVSTHNLQAIDVEFPRNQMTVVTGLSGSGKSSLVFDSLFAESQQRFTESFSTYARSLMTHKHHPEILQSYGLSPAIAINGHSVTRHPRSTVGTVSGIYDAYRLLYSRIGLDRGGDVCQEWSSVFSFNHEAGACPHCKGLGLIQTGDPHKLITNPDISIADGALNGTKAGKFYGEKQGQFVAILIAMAEAKSIDIEKPWKNLSELEQNFVMYGTGDETFAVKWHFKRKNREGVEEFGAKWPGFVWYINDEYERKHDSGKDMHLLAVMKAVECDRCNGSRINTGALDYTVVGLNIDKLSRLEVSTTIEFFNALENEISESKFRVARDLVKHIIQKLRYLKSIGLGYLNMTRSTMSLSGGEARRLRLVSQLGGTLTGITYVLDEPTIGLHSSDTKKLIELLKKLVAEGNTVVVVEHDKELIQAAGHILEIGPGAGTEGGKLVASGSPEQIRNNKQSVSAAYLSDKVLSIPEKPPIDLQFGLQISEARANNLKNLDLNLPLNGITVFQGVSGSGKSSLVFDVIERSAEAKCAVNCDAIEGLERFSGIISMDQSPVGNSPVSTPLTFLGVFDDIKKLFGKTATAKESGFKAGHFSYHSALGACPECKGSGRIKTAMDFMADVWTLCERCAGRRYKPEILKVTYRGMNIFEVLSLTMNEAFVFFKEDKHLKFVFGLLDDLGLGHLQLGQAANTFSGGESQRLKLARELIKESKGKYLYLLDEPTTGLHFKDVEKLMAVLFKIREKGHAVYLVEHNEQIINLADYSVCVGPEGGEKGGFLM